MLSALRAFQRFSGSNGHWVAMRRGSVVYYLHGDHLGSTSLVTDQAGDKVAEQRYEPWGVVRWQDGMLPTDFAFTLRQAQDRPASGRRPLG